MALVRVWPSGSSGGFAGPGSVTKRGEIRGWSAGSARRLLAWLWSVNPDGLARSDGWAVTLTVGETPETASEFHAARVAFLKRLKRDGIELVHWVIEWTAKGRPHMHLAVYGPGDLSRTALVAWLAICDAHGWPASARAQHIVPIHGAVGWLQYVGKHAARGVRHYQRQGIPPGWTKSGRLWGHSGEWPVEVPLEVELETHQFWWYRREVTKWQRRRMIRDGVKPYRANRLGTRFGDPRNGRMQGVSGWCPEHVSVMLLEAALDLGVVINYENWEYDNESQN